MKKALLLLILMALPLMAHAEVYKWKDASGKTIYSDVPPPSNIKQESVVGKKPAAPTAVTTKAAPAPAASDANKAAADKDAAARKRQEDAEAAKKKDEEKQAELKQKQQNCTNAKANVSNYKLGGRIATIDEKGERNYMDDAAVAKALEQAQKDVEEFCE